MAFNFIDMVIEAPAEKRAEMLRQMSAMTQTSVESLQAELDKRLAATAAKRKTEENARKRAAHNAAIEAARVIVESIRGNLEALQEAFDTVQELGGNVVVSGFDGDTVLYTVSGLKEIKTRGGGKGGGKPAANQPRPFVSDNGERVTGSLNKWAVEAFGLDVIESAADTQEVELSYSDKGELRSKNVAKVLLKAGLIVKSEVTAAEQAAFEATRS